MRRAAFLLPGLIAGLTCAGQALAQDAPEAEAAPPEKEIIVEAPRGLPAPQIVGRAPHTGAPVMLMTLRIPVLYGDLDLADPGDVVRLYARIERVAQDACKELDSLYPMTGPDAECVLQTVKRARPAADAAIAETLAGAAPAD